MANLGKWLHSFLTEGKQFVLVNGGLSPESVAIRGVLQGSVLGLLLLIIHVGDMDEGCQYSEVSYFTDDIRIRK